MNFSDTVCVLSSSSLPAREGARESSKGEAKGDLESRVMSDSQLVRREDMFEGEPRGDSSRKGFMRDFWGSGSSSADSAIPALA